MTKHPDDWKLWQFSRNLLNENEFKEIRMHILDCPECMGDLVSLVELNQLEELDNRGELPELSDSETENVLRFLGISQRNISGDVIERSVLSHNMGKPHRSFEPLAGMGTIGLATGGMLGSVLGAAIKSAPLNPGLAASQDEISENLKNDVKIPLEAATIPIDDQSTGHLAENNVYSEVNMNSLGFAAAQPGYGLSGMDELSPGVDQGYDSSCAVRCQELIMREFGIYIPQEQLMKEAESHGWFTLEGGTPMEDVGKLLELYNIPVTQYEGANIFNLTAEIAKGHKIIVGVDADELWGRTGFLHDLLESLGYETPNHALLVSGVDISDPNDVKVIITDPGTGDIAKAYPMQEFLDAWKDSNYFMVATNEPVPMHMNSPEMTYFNYAEGHIPMVGNISYDEFEERFSPFFGLSCNDSQFSDALELMTESQEFGYVPESVLTETINEVVEAEQVTEEENHQNGTHYEDDPVGHPENVEWDFGISTDIDNLLL